jgi:hypothetical protein
VNAERIARTEQAREARSRPLLARYSLTVAGGSVCAQTPDHWGNRWMGAGLHGPVANAHIDCAEAFWYSHGVTGSVTTCPWTHSSLVEHLSRRGYRVTRTLQAWARAVGPLPASVPLGSGVSIHRVDPDNPIECMHHISQMAWGFGQANVRVPAVDVEVGYRVITHPMSSGFLARRGDQVIGASTLECREDQAAFFGSVVVDQERRKGIQHAFFRHRMRVAMDLGATTAVVTGEPGSTTSRTAERLSFEHVYDTQTWTREG